MTPEITLSLIGRITHHEGLVTLGQRAPKAKPKAAICTKYYGGTYAFINILGPDSVKEP